MNSKTYQTAYERKLGAHHIAYLRALAEGIDPLRCAKTYLDVQEPSEARLAHQDVMETARAVARRIAVGDSAWRLLGLIIRPKAETKQITLDAFILARGLEEFPIDEAKAQYFEAFPDLAQHQAKPARRRRLYERQMALIRTIEAKAIAAPSKTDPVAGWFDPATAERLVASGLATLGDLVTRVNQSPTWYTKTHAIGSVKARRIEAQAKRLLPEPELLRFELSPGPDQALIDTWLVSGLSPATEKNYRREALRFQLWLKIERSGLPLDQVTTDDVVAYKAFLHAIPKEWISPTASRSAPFTPGWAPFREQMAAHSIGVCVSALSSLYAWLVHTDQISQNPWSQGHERGPSRRIYTALGGAQLIRYLQSQPRTIDSATALAAAALQEVPGVTAKSLIDATVSDWQLSRDGSATLRTSRKEISVPASPADLVQQYLTLRGPAMADAPLFAHTRLQSRGLTSRSLNQLLDEWREMAKRDAESPLP